jgi:hypothetical protein
VRLWVLSLPRWARFLLAREPYRLNLQAIQHRCGQAQERVFRHTVGGNWLQNFIPDVSSTYGYKERDRARNVTLQNPSNAPIVRFCIRDELGREEIRRWMQSAGIEVA